MAMPPPEPSLRGYPRMAALMGDFPDVAIFRRFGSLTMFNLISMQAELIEIEEKLHIRQLQDDTAHGDANQYSTTFPALRDSKKSKEGDLDHPNQKVLLEVSRQKLIEYHNLLLTAAQVARLRKPEESRIKFLRRWLRHDTGGANFLKGIQYVRTWDVDVQRDLVALTAQDSEENSLGTWFTPKLISAYHALFQKLRKPVRSEGGDVYDFEDSKFVQTLTWSLTLLATMAASILPSLIILWLFYVKRTVVRIWITIGCTVGIGLFLKVFTNANMKEIFGGSAAFAAVEVVFIGSANGTYAGT